MPIAVLEGASGMSDTMKTAIDNSFQAVQTNVTDIISSALPVGLTIMGVMLAITLGIKCFKRISKS